MTEGTVIEGVTKRQKEEIPRMGRSSSKRTVLVIAVVTALIAALQPQVQIGPSITAHGFIIQSQRKQQQHLYKSRPFQVSTDRHTDAQSSSIDEVDDGTSSDEQLLREVTKTQLVELCEQYQLPVEGTKTMLLQRLRDFASEQAEVDRQRRLKRKSRVEDGAEDQNGKERYEVISEDPEDDVEEDEGYFFFHAPEIASKNVTEKIEATRPKKPAFVSNDMVTAPPPPPIEPNENGERVVTVYSTKEQNDLTGVAAAQPGQSMFSNDAMMTGSDTSSSAPWDMKDAPVKAGATTKELEEAKETVSELVHALLAMTGAPAFREEFSEGLQPMTDVAETLARSSPSAPEGFVGFDPAKVPGDILTGSSKALRAGRGQVLQDVLRDVELRAVGHDGMAGDDIANGGGHYREVSKVRAFLEGYRRAEVRRVARETATVLLDKLVTEGVEGLDFLLASMTKSSDDTGEAGELSNSLLDYLNDAIRQQEKRVEQILASSDPSLGNVPSTIEVDKTSRLWNVTTEQGQRVETLDPNDPEVQKVLREEYAKSQDASLERPMRPTPRSGPEQLLLLLSLLRDRIKAEAAFSNDEKGRNLRILAYCLHASTDKEREDIILKEVRQSIDRLDSFLELVESSIEYAESTSHELQPSKTRPLNLRLLKSIRELASDLREKQAWKAAGLRYHHSHDE